MFQVPHLRHGMPVKGIVSPSPICLSHRRVYVGLDAKFQTVAVRPTWAQAERTLIRYEHIVAVGRLDARDEYIVDLLPAFTATGRDTRVIDDQSARALYYNNLGAELIVEGRYDEAIEKILQSITLWPDHSDSWNNLGAAYKRYGQNRLAELSYKRALRYDRYNYSALANLTQFYLVNDRQAEAEQFLRRVNRYYSRNPYFHYYMARLHFSGQEYVEARDFLQKAIRLKGDDPEFYIALADTHESMGDMEAAKKMRKRAAKVKPLNRRYRGEQTRWNSVVTRINR